MLTALYAAGGAICFLLYFPQVLKYLRCRESRKGISVLTWGGWVCMSIVTSLYAAIVVQDITFLFVSGLNASAQGVVFVLGVIR
jgi:hypothetical protein